MTIFANAKTVAQPKTSKKKEKPTFEIKGLFRLAFIDSTIKTLEGLKVSADLTVKSAMMNKFISLGKEIGRRPDNFSGKEKNATASCQLKLRSRPLAEEEIAYLLENNIPVEDVSIPAMYVINPEYFNNQELLEKVSKALSKIKDLPEDFIQVIPAKDQFKANEETLDAIFAAKVSDGEMETMIKMVTTIAVAPKLTMTEDELKNDIVGKITAYEI